MGGRIGHLPFLVIVGDHLRRHSITNTTLIVELASIESILYDNINIYMI